MRANSHLKSQEVSRSPLGYPAQVPTLMVFGWLATGTHRFAAAPSDNALCKVDIPLKPGLASVRQ